MGPRTPKKPDSKERKSLGIGRSPSLFHRAIHMATDDIPKGIVQRSTSLFDAVGKIRQRNENLSGPTVGENVEDLDITPKASTTRHFRNIRFPELSAETLSLVQQSSYQVTQYQLLRPYASPLPRTQTFTAPITPRYSEATTTGFAGLAESGNLATKLTPSGNVSTAGDPDITPIAKFQTTRLTTASPQPAKKEVATTGNIRSPAQDSGSTIATASEISSHHGRIENKRISISTRGSSSEHERQGLALLSAGVAARNRRGVISHVPLATGAQQITANRNAMVTNIRDLSRIPTPTGSRIPGFAGSEEGRESSSVESLYRERQYRPRARMSLQKPTNTDSTPPREVGWETVVQKRKELPREYSLEHANSFRESPTPLGPAYPHRASPQLPDPPLFGFTGHPSLPATQLWTPTDSMYSLERPELVYKAIPDQQWLGRFDTLNNALKTEALKAELRRAHKKGRADMGANVSRDSANHPSNSGMLNDTEREKVVMDQLFHLCATEQALISFDRFFERKTAKDARRAKQAAANDEMQGEQSTQRPTVPAGRGQERNRVSDYRNKYLEHQRRAVVEKFGLDSTKASGFQARAELQRTKLQKAGQEHRSIEEELRKLSICDGDVGNVVEGERLGTYTEDRLSHARLQRWLNTDGDNSADTADNQAADSSTVAHLPGPPTDTNQTRKRTSKLPELAFGRRWGALPKRPEADRVDAFKKKPKKPNFFEKSRKSQQEEQK